MGSCKIINRYLLSISLSPKESNFYKKLEVIRTMPSRRWDNERKVWIVPYMIENIEKMKDNDDDFEGERLCKPKTKTQLFTAVFFLF